MPMHKVSKDLSYFVNLLVSMEIQVQKGYKLQDVADVITTASNNQRFCPWCPGIQDTTTKYTIIKNKVTLKKIINQAWRGNIRDKYFAIHYK